MFWMTRGRFRFPLLGLLGLALSTLPAACVRSTLSLEDAKQVTLSIQKTALVPPPRRAYDVVDLLQRDDHNDTRETRKFWEAARADPAGRPQPPRLGGGLGRPATGLDAGREPETVRRFR